MEVLKSYKDRGKRRAKMRQMQAEEAFSKKLTENTDLESILIKKIEQRNKGGANGLMKAFRRFDMRSDDGAEISYDQFKQCLEKFGLYGIQDADVRKLFDKYDTDGSGTIEFNEFSNAISSRYQQNWVGNTANDLRDAANAREKMRLLKIQAERNKWQVMKINLRRTLREKIEQRIRGGANTLRLAFRKFLDDADSDISFEEFVRTLSLIGLDGLEEQDMRDLFDSFDDDNSGGIDFSEFVQGVMGSQKGASGVALTQNASEYDKWQLMQAQLKSEKRTQQHWKYATKHFDIEAIIRDKILQKTSGGPQELMRAFALFDTERDEKSEITLKLFKEGLERLGLNDVPDEFAEKLFNKFDTSGDGIISFNEFICGVLGSLAPLTSGKRTSKRKTRRRRRRSKAKRADALGHQPSSGRSDHMHASKTSDRTNLDGILNSARISASPEVTSSRSHSSARVPPRSSARQSPRSSRRSSRSSASSVYIGDWLRSENREPVICSHSKESLGLPVIHDKKIISGGKFKDEQGTTTGHLRSVPGRDESSRRRLKGRERGMGGAVGKSASKARPARTRLFEIVD